MFLTIELLEVKAKCEPFLNEILGRGASGTKQPASTGRTRPYENWLA